MLLLLYPTGRLVSRRWLWAGVTTVLSIVIIAGLSTAALWQYRDRGASLLDVEESTLDARVELLFNIGLILLMVGLGGAFVSLVVRWRRSEPIVRLQLKWLLFGGLVMCVQVGTVFTEGAPVVFEVLLLLGLTALPTSIAVAILRYRLFEIDRIISRTVTYAVVTALLVAAYLGSVFVLRSLLPVQGQLAVAGSTVATAALFNPVRRRVQRFVDRRFNRSGYDAERTLMAFTDRLRGQVDLEALNDAVHFATRDTVEPASVSIWVR